MVDTPGMWHLLGVLIFPLGSLLAQADQCVLKKLAIQINTYQTSIIHAHDVEFIYTRAWFNHPTTLLPPQEVGSGCRDPKSLPSVSPLQLGDIIRKHLEPLWDFTNHLSLSEAVDQKASIHELIKQIQTSPLPDYKVCSDQQSTAYAARPLTDLVIFKGDQWQAAIRVGFPD